MAAKVKGIRGAITVDHNDKQEILDATKELLVAMQENNNFHLEDIACIFFTVTADLNAAFPAKAARELGLVETALLCGNEIDVPGSLPRCIRVMILVNTCKKSGEIKHIYLRDAAKLRTDLGKGKY